MEKDLALYFVVNLPKKAINMDDWDPLRKQMKKDKNEKNEKLRAENT